VAFEGSFHGRTLGALSLTWSPRYREPFEPLLPRVRFSPWNDLAAARDAVGPQTAAVIVEPVQGETGVRPAQPAFLQGLAALCRERGALLILDEVQCGLGRTGRLFAYEHFGITPDLLTLAKPLGGGLPLGAVLMRDELGAGIVQGDHGSTFGGNPVAAAAARVVLDRLTAPRFLAGVARKGALLRKGLERLAARHSGLVSEVRGLGLMVGVELDRDAAPVLARLREHGVLAVKAGDRVVRLLPPLVIKKAELEEFLTAFEQSLEEVAGASS
jgi:acetylornithine/succinyldiaminopimelate/putrescine aminotransferase